jgi:hypothetical protein
MDEPETPVQAELRETTSTASENDMRLQQSVSNAAAGSWAIAELLGCCFLLQEMRPVEPDWTGDKLVKLQENYTPREKIRALVEYIHSWQIRWA